MAKIGKLTEAQQAKFADYREKWLRIGLSTERADRPRAEAGVKLAYELAGLKPPQIIIWLDSPTAGAMGAALLSGTLKVRAQVWDQVRAQVRAQVWDQVRAQVGDQVRAQVWAQVRAQVWDQVRAQVWAQVRDQVWAQVGDQVWAQVYRAVYGQYEAGWLSWLAFFREQCRPDLAAKAKGLDEVARSCGWWWPFENAVILTERPLEIHRDDQNRLHNESGAALLYPDGTDVWSIHGLRVPQQVIEKPATLTFEQVRDEPNAEIRRHMLDRFGGLRGDEAQAAWITAGGLNPVSEEDITDKMQPSGLSIWKLSHGNKPVTCRLYRADIRDDEPLAVLIVVCTSTAKEVSLRVPPHFKNAKAARNWTFGDDVSLEKALET